MKLLSTSDYETSLQEKDTNKLQISGGVKENISSFGYHLGIGDGEGDILSYTRGRITLEDGRSSIEIEPNETILVKSKEYFNVPKTICGFGVNRVWDCVRQLRIDPTFIDPGYKGRLHMVVTNFGSHALTLTTKEPLLKIVMWSIEESNGGTPIPVDRNDIYIYSNQIGDQIKRKKNLIQYAVGIFIVLTCLGIAYVMNQEIQAVLNRWGALMGAIAAIATPITLLINKKIR